MSSVLALLCCCDAGGIPAGFCRISVVETVEYDVSEFRVNNDPGYELLYRVVGSYTSTYAETVPLAAIGGGAYRATIDIGDYLISGSGEYYDGSLGVTPHGPTPPGSTAPDTTVEVAGGTYSVTWQPANDLSVGRYDPIRGVTVRDGGTPQTDSALEPSYSSAPPGYDFPGSRALASADDPSPVLVRTRDLFSFDATITPAVAGNQLFAAGQPPMLRHEGSSATMTLTASFEVNPAGLV